MTKTQTPMSDDDWWKNVMSEQEHDELEKTFEQIVAEHETPPQVEITILVDRDMIVTHMDELAAQIVIDREWPPILRKLGNALAEEYMNNPDIEPDERANRHWHLLIENDPTIEDMWDDDDDDTEWDRDDD